MKYFITLIILLLLHILIVNGGDVKAENGDNSFRKLTAEEERVIVHKGTELPFSGEYNSFYKEGSYHCKRCDAKLYNSTDKFNSGCGWPSFDDEVKGAVLRKMDADGHRTEILCNNCNAHLGHVFEGEGFTDTNIRHCVNSISLVFKEKGSIAEAYFAGGCFWGVEYFFEKEDGVLSAESGYMGGRYENPTYEDVLSGETGHLEVVKVSYDPTKTNYEKLSKLFFEIHDPTQKFGQGPDIGKQYLSAIFYKDIEEKKVAINLIDQLKSKGYDVATMLKEVTPFYKAEGYHQDYYKRTGKAPYCHGYTKRF